MVEKVMKYKYFIGIGMVLAIILGYQWLNTHKDEQIQQIVPVASIQEKNNDIREEKGESKYIMVDIKGAVKVSGVYELLEGKRVKDAIELAGGVLEKADKSQVNFAQILEDEMVIYVPLIGKYQEQNVYSMVGNQKQSDTININKATSEELQTIPGVGPSKAEAIIQYREENGLFQKIEDITNVSGIGDKSFERIKERITIK